MMARYGHLDVFQVQKLLYCVNVNSWMGTKGKVLYEN